MKLESSEAMAIYSFSEDILFARPIKRNYKSSVQVGEIILDLDKKNKVVGIELLNASKFFGVSKLFIHNLKELKMRLTIAPDFIKLEGFILSILRSARRISNLNLERINHDLSLEDELQITVK